MAAGVLGFRLADLPPLLVPSVNQEPRFTRKVDDAASFTTESIICIPLKIRDKVLGVIGLGRIGSAVAKRAQGMEMKVMACDPYITEEKAELLGIKLLPMAEVFKSADFITVHLPLTKESKHLLGKDAFEMMKPGVRIVNCARGGIVDEEALYEAMKSGKVAGAAMDVFEKEPNTESPLLQLNNFIATPHLGASTYEAQINVAVAVADGVAVAVAESVAIAVGVCVAAGVLVADGVAVRVGVAVAVDVKVGEPQDPGGNWNSYAPMSTVSMEILRIPARSTRPRAIHGRLTPLFTHGELPFSR
mgnify:CR=1 FL=1